MIPEDRDAAHDDDPPAVVLPRWVPVLLAFVLVLIAAFAVYTGVRYRGGALGRSFTSVRTAPAQDGGSPGEPQPGASRVLPGEAGGNVPSPSLEPFQQGARVKIEGGREGVAPFFHGEVRRGIRFSVRPDDAIFYVNDKAIGLTTQFSSPDEVYEFAEPGRFTIRVSAPNHRDRVYLVTVGPTARDETGVIEVALERE
ncbi:MAG TPA: hypothetical protein VMT00_11815 [Thermoanaerobaculia bacterium]|nr:hypothetical protein [Thermoanaerobaculia bacterium]